MVDSVNNIYTIGTHPKQETISSGNRIGRELSGSGDSYPKEVGRQEQSGSYREQFENLRRELGLSYEKIKEVFDFNPINYRYSENDYKTMCNKLLLCKSNDGKLNEEKLEIFKLCNKYNITYLFEALPELVSLDSLNQAVEYVTKKYGKNFEQHKKEIIKYATVLHFSWTCEGFDEFNKKNSDSLMDRLRGKKLIGREKLNLNDEKQREKVLNATKLYLTKTFDQIRAAKAKEFQTQEELDDYMNRLLEQTVIKLIANSDGPQQKGIIRDAVMAMQTTYPELYSKIFKGALNVELSKCDTAEQAQKVRDEFVDEAQLHFDTSTLNMTQEQKEAAAKTIAQVKVSDGVNEKAQRKNDKKIVKAKQELEQAKKNGNKQEIKKAEEKYENLKSSTAILDNAISLEPEKENFIKDRAIANTEMQQQNPDIYIDIQRTKNNVIDNSTTLSNEEKNKLRQIYNEITNGNFSKIAKDLLIKPSDLNPPADPNKFGKGAQSDVGYKTQQNQQSLTNAKTNVEALKQEIVQQTKTNEEPRIIKVEPHKETKSKNLPGNGNQFIKGLNITSLSAAVIPVITGNELKELIDNNAATISDAIKGFQKLTDSARTLVVDTVKRMSVAQQSYVLNKTDNSTKSKIIIEGNLDYEQLNVDLDFNHKKLLEEDVA